MSEEDNIKRPQSTDDGQQFDEQYGSIYQQKQFNPGKMIQINSVYQNELINQLMSLRENNVFEIGLYSYIKIKAENIIGFLRKEYHLSE
jgi:hypothetical protein